MSLTQEDSELITNAIVKALGKWSLICFLCGVVVWLLVTVISNAAESSFFGGGQ